MPTPLQVVKNVYQRFAEGDIEGFLAICSDDIEWVVNGPPTLKKCNAFRGRAGVQEFLKLLAAWNFESFQPREFVATGKTVVVLGEEKGTDTSSGSHFENRWAHVFDVKGEKVTRFREFLCHWTDPQRPPAMTWSAP